MLYVAVGSDCTCPCVPPLPPASVFTRFLCVPPACTASGARTHSPLLAATWAPVLKVGGRTFPVTVHYARARDDAALRNYEREVEVKVAEIHTSLPPTDLPQRQNHDVLVFLAQADEVERTAKRLAAALPDCLCVPLHGGLDPDEQRLAFAPADPQQYRRKVVVATNIAETSVTIDGVGTVVDAGFSKQACFDPAKDATVLRVARISQASARQRAGRGGRTAPGQCFRLCVIAYVEWCSMRGGGGEH